MLLLCPGDACKWQEFRQRWAIETKTNNYCGCNTVYCSISRAHAITHFGIKILLRSRTSSDFAIDKQKNFYARCCLSGKKRSIFTSRGTERNNKIKNPTPLYLFECASKLISRWKASMYHIVGAPAPLKSSPFRECFNICLHIRMHSTELIEIDSKVDRWWWKRENFPFQIIFHPRHTRTLTHFTASDREITISIVIGGGHKKYSNFTPQHIFLYVSWRQVAVETQMR